MQSDHHPSRMHRHAATLAVAGLLVLAGCAGFGAAPGATDRPPSTPTSPLPPGTSLHGVAEPSLLVEAHETVLDGTSYTVTERREIRYANGTLYTRRTAATRMAANGPRYLYDVSVRGTAPRFYCRPNGSLAHYSDGSIVFRLQETASGTTYDVVRNPRRDAAAPGAVYHGTPRNDDRLRVLLGGMRDTSVTRGEGDGYRLRATWFVPDALDVAGVRVTNVTTMAFEATVTPDGLVRAYSLSFGGEVDGRPVTVRERVTYSALGATAVEAPPWTDRVDGT